MNVLVLHGPNLNLLGSRPGDAPLLTLDKLNTELVKKARSLSVKLKTLQSNHEGVLIDALHKERAWADGVILNPGALAHYSYVLRDAIAAIQKPTFEVHLSDLLKREAFRHHSVLAEVCQGQIMGLGAGSYLTALEKLAAGGDFTTSRAVAASPTKKTIGKRQRSEPPAPAATAKASGGKTLGRRSGSHRAVGSDEGVVTRKVVRQKIAERLQGKLTPAGLATWARGQWLEVQRGAPAEQGQRDALEDALQTLTLSAVPASRLSDEQLVELMAQLE